MLTTGSGAPALSCPQDARQDNEDEGHMDMGDGSPLAPAAQVRPQTPPLTAPAPVQAVSEDTVLSKPKEAKEKKATGQKPKKALINHSGRAMYGEESDSDGKEYPEENDELSEMEECWKVTRRRPVHESPRSGQAQQSHVNREREQADQTSAKRKKEKMRLDSATRERQAAKKAAKAISQPPEQRPGEEEEPGDPQTQ